MTLSEELERLHQLHQAGGLTDEEFATAKARLLQDEAKSSPLGSSRLRDRLHDGRFWAMLLHLSLLLNFLVPAGGFIVPFLIWQLGKERFPELDQHGKNVVNFILSYGIYTLVIFSLLTITGIGLIAVPLLWYVILGVLSLLALFAAWSANQGRIWQYPLCFRFFK
ncbi:MAG: DUF4870 domain-containing protein [Thermogutta sp.]